MATRTYLIVVGCGPTRRPRYEREHQADALEDAQAAARAFLDRARRHDAAGPAWDYWAVRLRLPGWTSPRTMAWGDHRGVTWTWRNYGFRG